MRRIPTFLCLGFLILAGFVYAQQFPTNNITQAKAIKLASRLRIGMPEAEVARILDKTNGLKCGGDVGGYGGWTRFYLLSNGCCLDLNMEIKAYRPGDKVEKGIWGGDGFLKSASLQSNKVEVLSISLTNAP